MKTLALLLALGALLPGCVTAGTRTQADLHESPAALAPAPPPASATAPRAQNAEPFPAPAARPQHAPPSPPSDAAPVRTMERSFTLHLIDAGAARTRATQDCILLDLRDAYLRSGAASARFEQGYNAGGVNWTLDVGPTHGKRLVSHGALPMEVAIPQNASFARSLLFLEVPDDAHALSAVDVNLTVSIAVTGQQPSVDLTECPRERA